MLDAACELAGLGSELRRGDEHALSGAITYETSHELSDGRSTYIASLSIPFGLEVYRVEAERVLLDHAVDAPIA